MTIYHPTEGNRFANVGFSGWVGLMTGMNDQKMGISEIGVSYPGENSEAYPEESRKGYPFTWMLKDIMQYTNTADEAFDLM